VLCFSGIIELVSQTDQELGFDNTREKTYYDDSIDDNIDWLHSLIYYKC